MVKRYMSNKSTYKCNLSMINKYNKKKWMCFIDYGPTLDASPDKKKNLN